MRPKTLALLVVVAAVIVGVLLAMHGDGRGVLVDWLRSLHGAR